MSCSYTHAEEVTNELIPDVDDTDGLDPEAEFEEWRARELTRLVRDKQAEAERDAEREEIERRRAMPEDQRMAEDMAYADATRAREKGEMGFLQKYYHKGAFHQDDEILNRDYTAATESQVDMQMLPKVMQVRDFGKASRTKYTHLTDQDTSSGGWGTAHQNFGRPGAAKGVEFGCWNCEWERGVQTAMPLSTPLTSQVVAPTHASTVPTTMSTMSTPSPVSRPPTLTASCWALVRPGRAGRTVAAVVPVDATGMEEVEDLQGGRTRAGEDETQLVGRVMVAGVTTVAAGGTATTGQVAAEADPTTTGLATTATVETATTGHETVTVAGIGTAAVTSATGTAAATVGATVETGETGNAAGVQAGVAMRVVTGTAAATATVSARGTATGAATVTVTTGGSVATGVIATRGATGIGDSRGHRTRWALRRRRLQQQALATVCIIMPREQP